MTRVGTRKRFPEAWRGRAATPPGDILGNSSQMIEDRLKAGLQPEPTGTCSRRCGSPGLSRYVHALVEMAPS